jgi:Ca-activated chloride channel homolog
MQNNFSRRNLPKIIGAISIIALFAAQFSGYSPLGIKNAYANGQIIKSKYTEDEIMEHDFKCPRPKYQDENRYMRKNLGMPRPMAAYAIAPPPPVYKHSPMVSPAVSPTVSPAVSPTVSNESAQIVGAPPPQAKLPPPPPLIERKTQIINNAPIPSMPNPYAIDGQTNTETYPHANINSVKSVSQEPVSTFAMEVDSASYTNSRRMINEGILPDKDVVRVEEFLNYFKYDYPKPNDKAAPFSTNVVVTPSPWNNQKQIIHIGINGFTKSNAQRPPLNLVLLLDVSGSMNSNDKLPLAKKAIKTLLPQLDSRDRVSMVVYAGASGVVLNPTRGNETRDIVCAMENLEAGGSTAGGQGIELAYKIAKENFDQDSVNRIVLMTDGDFNVGINDPNRLKEVIAKKRETGIYLSVLGFGTGNYDDEIMQSLAQNGNGIAAYIDTLAEARKIFKDDFSANMFPIANDVKAQIEFNPKRVQEYRLVGYETRALNREDFNNDKIDAGEIGAGHQITAIYEITPIGAKPNIDPLRYQTQEVKSADLSSEFGYLRLRYKLPNQSQSKLIERAINEKDNVQSIENAPNSTKFALAVASFAQKLRNDPWIGNFNYDNIIALAKNSNETNDYGMNDDFIMLVKKAKNLENKE